MLIGTDTNLLKSIKMLTHYDRAFTKGVLALIATTMLWGTSFVFIKLSVSTMDPTIYVGLRSLLALFLMFLIFLTSSVLNKKNQRLISRDLYKGFLIGVISSLGLFLQGEGAKYITPATNAFITGLSTLHVHIYVATRNKTYNIPDLFSLILALGGLYLFARPGGVELVGTLLVLASTFFWAAQILMISMYSRGDLNNLMLGYFAAGALFIFIAPINSLHRLSIREWFYILYLAIFCSVAATLLQLYGQRFVSAKTASTIYLLEPFFAYLYSLIAREDYIDYLKILGGSLIVAGVYVAQYSEMKYSRNHSSTDS
ncbi:MAG: DMT family transporter [Sulfolobales archaeon]